LLQPNSELAVAELKGKIYVIGGYPSTRITVATVQAYDTKKDSWELKPPLPRPLNHAMVAAANGKLYVIGGQTDASAAYVNTLYEFDPTIAVWTVKAPMPTQRSAGAAVVLDGKIFVVGGRPPHGNEFAGYDPIENVWTTLPNMPTQRNHLAAAAIGKIYVAAVVSAAGRQRGDGRSRMFDPGPKTWSLIADDRGGGVNALKRMGVSTSGAAKGKTRIIRSASSEHEVQSQTDVATLDNMPISFTE
jgi:N-acetylneuraminic acid mutarotase